MGKEEADEGVAPEGEHAGEPANAGLSKGGQAVLNSVAKSNLPRSLRPRVKGQPTDPVPEGMQIAAARETRLQAQEGDEDKPTPLELSRRDKAVRLDMMRETAHAHNDDKQAVGRSGGMPVSQTTPPGQKVCPKTMQSATNKLPDSRQRPQQAAWQDKH